MPLTLGSGPSSAWGLCAGEGKEFFCAFDLCCEMGVGLDNLRE